MLKTKYFKQSIKEELMTKEQAIKHYESVLYSVADQIAINQKLKNNIYRYVPKFLQWAFKHRLRLIDRDLLVYFQMYRDYSEILDQTIAGVFDDYWDEEEGPDEYYRGTKI